MNKAKYMLMLALLVASQLIQAQGLTPFQNKKGKWGYKNAWGKVRIKARYSTAAKFDRNLAVVSRKQKYGVIDTHGKRVLKRKYAAVEILDVWGRIFKVKQTNKTGFQYGVVGTQGKVYLPVEHRVILPVKATRLELGLIVAKAKKYALYTYQGKALTGFDYDDIQPMRYDSQRILAKKNGLYGYLDKNGAEVIPFVYSKAKNFLSRQAMVVKDGESFYINPKGQKLSNGALIETRAEPEGGLLNFYKYIARKLRYPSKARQRGVSGRVFVKFDVNIDGTVGNVRVLRGIGSGCDEEAVRIIKNGSKWVPATQRGKTVKSMMTIPINFKLR